MKKNIFLLSILSFISVELLGQNLYKLNNHNTEDCYNRIVKRSEPDSVVFYSGNLNERENSSNTAIVNQTGSENKISINQSGFSNFVRIQKNPGTYSTINQTGCQNLIELLESKYKFDENHFKRHRSSNYSPLKFEFFNQRLNIEDKD